MKPKFIITSINVKQIFNQLPQIINFQQIAGKISYDLEISVESSGDFSKYVKKKKINNGQIIADILMGKLELAGYNKI